MARESASIVLPRLLLLLRRKRPSSGQSLVEFALLLPLLLVIVLGVVDFGRVFQAGIVMESATRAGQRPGAVEYLREVQQGSGVEPDYDLIRERGCRGRMSRGEAPNVDRTPNLVRQWPIIRVCIHDLAAGRYRLRQPEYFGIRRAIPEQCPETESRLLVQRARLRSLPTDANPDAARSVRRGSDVLSLHHAHSPRMSSSPFGEVFLQKESVFTVADY